MLTIDTPINLRSTITSNIINTINRNLNIITNHTSFTIENFIQTDTTINPKNSNKTLVNLKNKLVKINTTITTTNHEFIKYGFAIPINLTKKIIDNIVSHNKVRKRFLNIKLKNITTEIANTFKLDRPQNILITTIYTKTPTKATKLKIKNIVLKVDNNKINHPNQIQNLITQKHPNDIVHLEIHQQNKTLNLQTKLNKQTNNFRTTSSNPSEPNKSEHYNLTIQNITPKIIESFKLNRNVENMIIINTEPRNLTHNTQFRAHNIIFKIRQNNIKQNIKSVENFNTTLEKIKKKKNTAFSIRQKRSRIFLTMKIPK